jgi:hypothetical protein
VPDGVGIRVSDRVEDEWLLMLILVTDWKGVQNIGAATLGNIYIAVKCLAKSSYRRDEE